MPAQIQSVTGDSAAANFVESADYHEVWKNVEEVKKPVVLICGTSGQGKTQIGQRITNEWSENHTRRTFVFQTQTNDLYNTSYSSILERNGWNQDSYWAPIPDRPKDYDFLKLCHYIKKKRSPSPEKILFHFDGLSDDEGRPTVETRKWKTKLYRMIRSFVSCAPAGMQLLVTVPMKPKNEELFVGNRVYIHTMEGFADDDIKTFFQRSLSHEPPEFLKSRVAEISKIMGRSAQLYQSNLKRFQSMGSEIELDDFLKELGDRLIEEKLRCLSYLRMWKVIINFGQINIPAKLFYDVLVYCCETGSLGLSNTDNADEIFSIMRSEFLRCDFITIVRVGSNNQQIHWIIRTDVHSCLVELAKSDSEAERQDYLTVGVKTMARIVDRCDRFHSDNRQLPDRYINMLSQTTLYSKITKDLMTNFSRCEKLTVYQLITTIHYAKLNKSDTDLTDDDLEKFYNKVQQLERLLSFKGEQLRAPEDELPSPHHCNVEYEPDTRTLYESMCTYLHELDCECDVACRQMDEKTLKARWKERDGKIEEHRAKEEYGMLAEEQLRKLCEIVLVLGSDAYRQVYPLEVLASMYIILGQMRERVNGIDGRAEFWAQSPHDIFNHVTGNIFEAIENVATTDFTQKVNIAVDDVWEDINETSFQQKRLSELKKLWKHGFTNQEGLIPLLNCIESLLEISGNILELEGKLSGGNGLEFIDPVKLWKERGLLKYQKKSGLDGDLSEDVRQKLVAQHGENAMFKDNKCLMSVVHAIQDGKTVHITEDMLAISDKLVSDYGQEGMELITKLMGVSQTLYENSVEKRNSWKQYSFVMRNVAIFMMKCGQMSEGFRYYTYALYSFYEYTERTVTERKFSQMCKEVIKLETHPPKPFPGLAAQYVGKKLKGRCICFPLADGGDSKCDSCSDDGLYKNFLRERQGIETESDEEKKAIDILLAKLTAPVPPDDDEPARETAIGN